MVGGGCENGFEHPVSPEPRGGAGAGGEERGEGIARGRELA